MSAEKSHFHNHSHAREYDRRAAQSEIRARLAPKLIEALGCRGHERVLDVGSGTGRFARPVAAELTSGAVIGVDEALAVLKVANEQKEREVAAKFLCVAGAAEAMPFRSGVFDRGFSVLAFHHFHDPGLMTREVYRVLKPGGSFIVLDPVVAKKEDSLDESIHHLINQILREKGENFCFYSVSEVERFLRKTGFRLTRNEVLAFFVDQQGSDGIPTGKHWLDIAERMRGESPEIRGRFEERYFRSEKKGEKTHIRGNFYYALICGEKG